MSGRTDTVLVNGTKVMCAPMSVEELRNILKYDPENGCIYRRNFKGHELKLISSKPVRGYSKVAILGRQYASHRIAWYLYTGEWPSAFIDHKNGKKSDNRIHNLREATKVQNAINIGPTAKNTSGYRGVSWDKHYYKWVAYFYDTGRKKKHLGYFATPEEASNAYQRAVRARHGNFSPSAIDAKERG